MAYNQPYNYGYGYPQYQYGAVPDMLNQFKGQYQQPMQTNPAPITQPTNDMIWVLNENEATSYPVGLNNSVVLWDKNNPTIYVKSVNTQGMPSMRILDFVERTELQENEPQKHECKCGNAFKENIKALNEKIENLEAKYEELIEKQSKSTKITKKEVE